MWSDSSQELSPSESTAHSSELWSVASSERLSAGDSSESRGHPAVSPSEANGSGMVAPKAPPSAPSSSEDEPRVHLHGECAVSNCTVFPP